MKCEQRFSTKMRWLIGWQKMFWFQWVTMVWNFAIWNWHGGDIWGFNGREASGYHTLIDHPRPGDTHSHVDWLLGCRHCIYEWTICMTPSHTATTAGSTMTGRRYRQMNYRILRCYPYGPSGDESRELLWTHSNVYYNTGALPLSIRESVVWTTRWSGPINIEYPNCWIPELHDRLS